MNSLLRKYDRYLWPLWIGTGLATIGYAIFFLIYQTGALIGIVVTMPFLAVCLIRLVLNIYVIREAKLRANYLKKLDQYEQKLNEEYTASNSKKETSKGAK